MFRAMTGKRGVARTALVGSIVLVVSVFGGIAWAVDNITKARRVDSVTTYYVNATPGAGEQRVQLLNLGGVVVSATCAAAYNSTVIGYPYGIGVGGGIFVTNNTTDRILVTTQPMADPGYTWLDADESDAVFGVGEWVNEGNATDLGGGSIWTFAILNHGGISATGTLARSAAVNPGDPTVTGDEMGECVFSIQAKG